METVELFSEADIKMPDFPINAGDLKPHSLQASLRFKSEIARLGATIEPGQSWHGGMAKYSVICKAGHSCYLMANRVMNRGTLCQDCKQTRKVNISLSEGYINSLEKLWSDSLEDASLMGVIYGTPDEQFSRLSAIRKWAKYHDPRISVINYSAHTKDDPSIKTSYLLREYRGHVRRGREGITRHPLYGIWNGIMTRCYNPASKAYKYYGERGIKICKAWHNPSQFIDYVETILGERLPEHSIDRRNNDRGYEPMNLRWATAQIQAVNKRNGKPSRSGYPGITIDHQDGKWNVCIKRDKVRKYIGRYSDLDEAISAQERAGGWL